jgi:hypothetical protein
VTVVPLAGTRPLRCHGEGGGETGVPPSEMRPLSRALRRRRFAVTFACQGYLFHVFNSRALCTRLLRQRDGCWRHLRACRVGVRMRTKASSIATALQPRRGGGNPTQTKHALSCTPLWAHHGFTRFRERERETRRSYNVSCCIYRCALCAPLPSRPRYFAYSSQYLHVQSLCRQCEP